MTIILTVTANIIRSIYCQNKRDKNVYVVYLWLRNVKNGGVNCWIIDYIFVSRMFLRENNNKFKNLLQQNG